MILDPGRSKGWIKGARLGSLLVGLWVASLLVAGCGPVTREADEQPPPAATVATQPPAPIDVVILHTNDNWGETEPCG
jgi:2',3'-cyclic-nucleotide 2'-phosphodiesterase (5'-nucleotidase family)